MLSIDPGLLSLTVVVFLALIFILNAILYKPILTFIDSRNKAIDKDEDDLKQRSDDTKTYKEEAENILAQARIQAAQIKDEATQKALKDAEEKVQVKKAALESDYKAFLDELSAQTSELKNELTAKLPEFKSSLRASLSRL